MTREARKRTRPRARTENLRRLKQERVRNTALLLVPDEAPQRPRIRGECPTERPCPWVGCRYHFYLDVHPSTGSIKLNFPDLEPWELTETCVLDVAARAVPDNERMAEDRHITLDEVAELMNLTRERVRQVEASALATLRHHEEFDE